MANYYAVAFYRGPDGTTIDVSATPPRASRKRSSAQGQRQRDPRSVRPTYSAVNVGTDEKGELVKLDPSKPAEVAWLEQER